MERNDRELTEQEADELERLCIASDTRPLTRDEREQVYLLQGWTPESAEWLADNGGRPME